MFGPFKKCVNAACDEWMRVNPRKTMNIYDIPGIVNTALPRAASHHITSSALAYGHTNLTFFRTVTMHPLKSLIAPCLLGPRLLWCLLGPCLLWCLLGPLLLWCHLVPLLSCHLTYCQAPQACQPFQWQVGYGMKVLIPSMYCVIFHIDVNYILFFKYQTWSNVK